MNHILIKNIIIFIIIYIIYCLCVIIFLYISDKHDRHFYKSDDQL